ncbi:pentatricopeptide repeat-containing protein mitochondrial-like [Dorcoceras hygrometricum]|uniref:Pentatricopeptide repeat-containing protein mitochondrial-like n=1 Tax=Dorcoceras hygrometricum TaxID=472368 RepID=A0A2Z7AFA6_9LAMI|nr:pentatricopeptide repeat-containing protein mitochondrial-like [Dorcoceras hygrometricum]
MDMQNTVACDWVHCTLRLVHHLVTGILCDWYLATGILRLVPCDWYLATAGYQRKEHLLNLSAKAKRCRINLFKRHRFAIANFKYQLLLLRFLSTAECDDITADVIIDDHSFLQ